MKRNCPHCGQEQTIADDEVIAPWVFIRCHECENLSILKSNAPRPEQARSLERARPERVRSPEPAKQKRSPSVRAFVVRPEAVIGAFVSAGEPAARTDRRTPIPVIPLEEEREWELPTYYSPFAAESE